MVDFIPADGDPDDRAPLRMGRQEVDGEVADLLHAVMRRVRRNARADLEPLGVTPAQIRALRITGRSQGALRMSDLAERLGIARRSATSVIDELEARGLVERLSDPADRRAVQVALTADGRRLLRTLARRRRTAATEVLSVLTDDEAASLHTLLGRVAHDTP